MKYIRNISLIFFISGCLFLSCTKEFLTRTPQGSLSDNVLATPNGINVLLTGAYAALDGQAITPTPWAVSPNNWIYGSVTGGEAHKGSSGGDQSVINPLLTYTVDANNPFLDEKWRADYEGVSRCNQVLKLLVKTTGLSEAESTNIKAQARFLRGHYYFDLKKMFNRVPWIDESTSDFNLPNDQDIWSKIQGDLTFAMDSLPESQNEIGRANKWAAAAYLAKAYLYEHKFQEAKIIFDQVILNGKTSNGLKYDLNKQFEDNYRPEKEQSSTEAVFSIEMAANTGTGDISNANNGDMLNRPYPTENPWCCGFFQPTQDLVNSFRTDPATGLPYLDDYNLHAVKNDMYIASTDAFVPDQGTLDPRLDWSVARRGIPFLDWGEFAGARWIRDQSYAGPYYAKKNMFWQSTKALYMDPNSWASGSAINYLVISYADVLLMAAECEAQIGSLDKAEAYVNTVRIRAANTEGWVYKYTDPNAPMGGFSSTPAANYFIKVYPAGDFTAKGKDNALKAIYFERKIELALVGHRFFDLVRWGIADVVLNAFVAYEGTITSDLGVAHFTKSKNEYYPIPQSEIDLSAVGGKPVLIQNAGFK